jgi:hypothetical protein
MNEKHNNSMIKQKVTTKCMRMHDYAGTAAAISAAETGKDGITVHSDG